MVIVGLILSLAGLLILLGYVYLINDAGLAKKQACKLSLYTRATASTSFQSGLPLKCSTEKICITESGGKESCKGLAWDDDVKVVKLSGSHQARADKIAEISANALYDCWDMMGRGRLDIFGVAHPLSFSDETEAKSRCVICSRVAISEELSNNEDVMGLVDLNGYLVKNNVPGQSRSYWDVIQDSSGAQTFTGIDFAESEQELRDSLNDNEDKELDKKLAELRDDSQNKNELAYVFAQQKTPLDAIGGLTSGARDSTIAIVGLHSVAGSIPLVGPILKKGLNSPVALIAQAFVVGGASVYSSHIAYGNQQASALYCGKFSSSAEAEDDREGCSLVRAVPYSAESVNKICNVIEGDL